MHGIFEWKGNRLVCNNVEVARVVRVAKDFWITKYKEPVKMPRHLSARRAKITIEKRFGIASI